MSDEATRYPISTTDLDTFRALVCVNPVDGGLEVWKAVLYWPGEAPVWFVETETGIAYPGFRVYVATPLECGREVLGEL